MDVLILTVTQFALSYMHDSELRSRASSNRNSYDPFGADHLDPMLLVSTIPPMHTLVLNKFPSITDHVSVNANVCYQSYTLRLVPFFCKAR